MTSPRLRVALAGMIVALIAAGIAGTERGPETAAAVAVPPAPQCAGFDAQFPTSSPGYAIPIGNRIVNGTLTEDSKTGQTQVTDINATICGYLQFPSLSADIPAADIVYQNPAKLMVSSNDQPLVQIGTVDTTADGPSTATTSATPAANGGLIFDLTAHAHNVLYIGPQLPSSLLSGLPTALLEQLLGALGGLGVSLPPSVTGLLDTLDHPPATTTPTATPSTTSPSTTVPSTTVPSTTVPSTTVPSTTVPSTSVAGGAASTGASVLHGVTSAVGGASASATTTGGSTTPAVSGVTLPGVTIPSVPLPTSVPSVPLSVPITVPTLTLPGVVSCDVQLDGTLDTDPDNPPGAALTGPLTGAEGTAYGNTSQISLGPLTPDPGSALAPTLCPILGQVLGVQTGPSTGSTASFEAPLDFYSTLTSFS